MAVTAGSRDNPDDHGDHGAPDEPDGSGNVRSIRRHAAGDAVPVDSLSLPRGWFALLPAGRLKQGQVVRSNVAGEELAVWRTDTGTVAVASAWCPHLGAHLGATGRVCGEHLECGFHGFRFSADGTCVGTGYGSRVPQKAHIRTWPVRETGGVLFTWFDPDGAPPDFEVPEIDESGYTAARWWGSEFGGHPLEVTENSVDVGHFAVLHGYDDVGTVTAASVDGPILRATYTMTRAGRATGLRLPTMRTIFDVTVVGLGLSIVDLTVETLGVRQRLYVLPTATAAGQVRLLLGASTRYEPAGDQPSWVRRVPPGVLVRALRDFTLLGLYFDVAQDRRYWSTKRHVPHPVLADGDGPIGLYRKWAAQFMPSAG